MPHIDENEVLRDALAGLKEEVPPMPEGLHAAWMQSLEIGQGPISDSDCLQSPSVPSTRPLDAARADKVEDDMAEKRTERILNRKGITRFLSVAAAMVFIVGGTLLTRDNPALMTADQAAENGAPVREIELKGARSYTTADYEEDSTADYDGGVMLTSMARGASNEAAPAAPEPTEKKIIRNASLTIQTQSFEASLENLRTLCQAEGGWVEFSRESVNASTGLRTASLTVRVPQEALDGYLAGSEQLGRITSRSESAEDVTASYQDTRARLDTQLALMERLQALMGEAGDLSDLLALESQIADTQYQIDRLQSSLNNTNRQVDYATVSVTLKEETTVELTDDTVTLGERIRSAVRVGWEAFTGFLSDMAVFLVAALPFIGVVAAVVIVLWIIRKIRRRKNV